MALRELRHITQAIAGCVSRKRDIQAAYVFGSVVSGKTRRDSDVDVAVLLSDRVSASKRFEYRLQLISDIGAALQRSDVDLVILNDASPLLAHRVLSLGKLIFERSPSARIRFQVMTANRYADLVPAYETYIHYLKKSVKEGRIIG
jgi:predicted nucleotidyltransferase